MAKTTVKSPGARRGRPALKPGSPKRSSFNTRLRTEIKQQLETEAQIVGRSLSEEIEFRLERSLQQEADSGGRQLHGLLDLLVGVAKIIQARTGKSASDDWKTGLAVGRAWKRLIHDWLPGPPAEWFAELERLSGDMPDAPVPPKPPKEPIRGGLLYPRASEEEWEAYEASRQDFIKDAQKHFVASTKQIRVFAQNRAALRRKIDEFNKALEIGEEALGLLSDPKNRR